MATKQAVSRVATRYVRAISEGRQFVRIVEDAIDSLKDAISLAEIRSSDSFESGQSLVDGNSAAADVVELIRDFSGRVDPLLSRIR